MVQRTALISLLLPTFLTTAAYGHHAFTAEFDPDKPVTLHGTVAKVEWVNPHGWIHLNVKGSSGAEEEWAIETGTPNALMRAGVTRQVLKPGTSITIEGYRAKDGSNRANGLSLKTAEGQSLFLSSSAPKLSSSQ
jgi:hypothetical protein